MSAGRSAGGLSSLAIAVPVSSSSTRTGSGVDLQGYEGQIHFTLQCGAVSGTTPTLDGKLQDSADNSSFADVTGATFAQCTTSNDKRDLTLDVRNLRRYVKVVLTIAGSSPVFLNAVSAVALPKYR